ncbi:MAG: fibrobacter succinogenes major paralogous domain-containing protein [Chitinispirillaceae bacterium]|nr:fibrobacter succinogenes major paralogous domain-containing protein [Chitinispirillaceae bacterium]
MIFWISPVKVIAYDSEGDSSGWSVERSTAIKTSLTDIDGNTYKVVRIGAQLWMGENLRTTKYSDGTAIPIANNNIDWEENALSETPMAEFCWYEDTTDTAAQEKWSALYNGYIVDPLNPKKIAPSGWHVPTEGDWMNLQNYLIANGYNYDETKTDNKIAKSMAVQSDWLVSTNVGAIGNDLNTNNKSGFSALPAGARNHHGGSWGKNMSGVWWSSTTSFIDVVLYIIELNYENSNLVLIETSKVEGLSVRLIRD